MIMIGMVIILRSCIALGKGVINLQKEHHGNSLHDLLMGHLLLCTLFQTL